MKMKKLKFALASVLVISFAMPMVANAETKPLETNRLTEGFSNDLQITENDLEMLSSAYQEGLKAGIEQAASNKPKPQGGSLSNPKPTYKPRKPNPKPTLKPKPNGLRDSRQQKKEQRERRRRETKVEKKQTSLPKKDFLTKTRITQKPGKKGNNGLGKTTVAKSEQQIRDEYIINKPLSKMTRAERQYLKQKLGDLLDDKIVQAFLDALEDAEGASPNTLVGKGIGKSKDCKDSIAKLDLSGHAVEQKLPSGCFYYNRDVGKISTAYGRFQLTYTNWKILKKYFNFKSFSIKNQGIAALELIRTSKGGKGFIALVKGKIEQALRRGTQPWASSPYSNLKGRKETNLLANANKNLRRHNNSQNG